MGRMDDGNFHEGFTGGEEKPPTKAEKIIAMALFDEKIHERVMEAVGDGISFEAVARFVNENEPYTIKRILKEFENDTF